LDPKATFKIVLAETTTIGEIYTGYLVPLAAIPAVAMLIRQLLIFRHFTTGVLVGAVLSYALTLLCIFIAGKIIDALAPAFGAARNGLNAFRVAAYAWTPALVAGILGIIPILAPLGLLASLYGIYLLYLGLLILMACPPAKAVAYTVVCVVVVIVLFAVMGAIVGAAMGFGPSYYGGFGSRGTAAGRIIGANMDSGNGNATIHTKDENITVGEDVRIPEDFPKDVFLYSGSKVKLCMAAPNGWNLGLETQDPAEKVLQAFKSKMTGSGWEQQMDMGTEGGHMVNYKKGDRSVVLTIAGSSGKTEISLLVAKDTAH
jgi:hypothetical protein